MALEQFRLGMKRRCFAVAISREATGKTMSHEHIAQIIAAPIIILIILWPPLFDFIGPFCVRFFNAYVRKKLPSREIAAEGRRHRQPEGLPEGPGRTEGRDHNPRGPDRRAACELEEGSRPELLKE
jgi:hypothetical protein